MSEDFVIGLDLGTTKSCAAYYKNNKIIILENSEGNRTTPSIVFYKNNNETMVNKQSKRLIENSPKSGVYDVKRLLGKSYYDASISKIKELTPFSIKNNNGDIELEISMPKGVVKQTPEQVLSHILRKLKNDIGTKFGDNVSNVVITIPSYFNVNQREATLKAAEMAGFNVLKLLNEPTAAALAYFHEVKNSPNDKYYLVYDLGGGSFDVSILKKTENEIKVIGIDGDTNLGGYDFDCKILKYVTDWIKQAHDNFDIVKYQNGKLIRRIQNSCEEAKRELSTETQCSIIISKPQCLVKDVDEEEKEGEEDDDDDDIIIDLSRTQFEELCFELFTKTINIVENCLKTANVTKDDIEEVILSGGSSRIPKIQNMLSTFFHGKKLQKINNLDESVAEGAALQAAMLSKCEIQKHLSLPVSDVVPFSIRVANFVDGTLSVIKRNTPLPATGQCSRITVDENQTNILLNIFEGECLHASQNYFLGSLTFRNLTPAPPGQCEVNLELTLDKNGILTYTATEFVYDSRNIVPIDYNKQHLHSYL